MLSLLKYLFIIACAFSFGFASLNSLCKIKSLILLLPLSFSFGLSAFIFICHILSYFLGPQVASITTPFVLLLSGILIFSLSYKDLKITKEEITIKQLISILFIALAICSLSFLAIYRFGTFDKEFHFQLAETIFHNNVYPPRDFYRPDYILLYHFGGDLLAGSIMHFCRIDVSRAYELITSTLSGITFLSFFALAWLLTKSFKISLIAGFCTYFGGGLLWLDAILRYLLKILPESDYQWNFLQTFFNIGIHGGIIDAPSLNTFLSTYGLGNPILILSLILFWKIVNENDLREKIFYIIFLNISLFALFMCAEWLYVTFIVSIIPFLLFMIFKKEKSICFSIIILLFLSVLLNKTLGNVLFLQDDLQEIGRVNIFDAEIKKKLFYIISWGRLNDITMNYQEVFCFSWDFISEFGLSLLLSPIALIYLIKSRDKLILILFSCIALTMPVPAIIEFKLNPVDLNRLFAFGNTMLIMLIICGIGTLYKAFLKNIFVLAFLLIGFCTSPFSGLVSGSLFTPYIFTSKTYVNEISEALKRVKSFSHIDNYFSQLNNLLKRLKNRHTMDFEEELKFLKQNSKPKDVAISSLQDVPAYAGVYSLIPAGRWLYKDLLYSSYDSIYLTALTTLDPYLLDELNIKWIILSSSSKAGLPKETQDFLNNPEILKLAFSNFNKNKQEQYEIYQINDLKNILNKTIRKTAWLLVNKTGQPVEIAYMQAYKITLFQSSQDALKYLQNLQAIRPQLKKELITAQANNISALEKQIKDSHLQIKLEKRF